MSGPLKWLSVHNAGAILTETKTKLKLDWCSHKAARYAVENWHYSQRMPKSKLVKIGVWENGVFIGVVIFGSGATRALVAPYNLTPEQGCELVRVALKKHDAPVTRIIKIALRMLKKYCPKLRLVVSFADPNEGHHGGIYQAGNWVYTGTTVACDFFKDKKGKVWHPRNVSEDLWRSGKRVRPSECERIRKEGKHRYLMPLDSEIKERVAKLEQPYPKR